MYIFITTGTFNYMRDIVLQHPNEKILFLQNFNQTTLLQEAATTSIFQEGRKYEVIDTIGSLELEGYVVMHHIPVTYEGRNIFEHTSQTISRSIAAQKGLTASRTLKPTKGETYILFTQWNEESSYQAYRDSTTFTEVQKLLRNDKKSNPQKIFTGDAYTTMYTVVPIEQND